MSLGTSDAPTTFFCHFSIVFETASPFFPSDDFSLDCPASTKTWEPCVARLLNEQKVHHFQVKTNDPVVFGVFDSFHHLLDEFMFLLQC